MSTSYVLDASALAKSFLEEGKSKEFRAWMEAALRRGDTLYAPHIAYSEIGRIIQKECPELKPDDARELHLATFLGVTLLPVNDQGGTWDHATGLTYYDAEYLDAAIATGPSRLVSGDEKQLKQADRFGIQSVSFSPSRPAKAA